MPQWYDEAGLAPAFVLSDAALFPMTFSRTFRPESPP